MCLGGILGEWKFGFTHFNPSIRWSAQLHALAVLPPEEEAPVQQLQLMYNRPQYTLCRGCVGCRAGLDDPKKGKIDFPFQGLNHISSLICFHSCIHVVLLDYWKM
jgi:hypothetical protein